MSSVNVNTAVRPAQISKIPLSRFFAGEDLICEGGFPEGGPSTVRWWIETKNPESDGMVPVLCQIQELDGRASPIGRLELRTDPNPTAFVDQLGGFGSFGCFATQGYSRARLRYGADLATAPSAADPSAYICMTATGGSPSEFRYAQKYSLIIADVDTTVADCKGHIQVPRGTTHLRAWHQAAAYAPVALTPGWLYFTTIALPKDSVGYSIYTGGLAAPLTDAEVATIAPLAGVGNSTQIMVHVEFRGIW